MSEPSPEARLRRDVAWNLVAFALMGVSGVALNMTVARLWDALTLGVLNQVLTFHILLGQIAAFGIHLSALKHVAEHAQRGDRVRTIIAAGFCAVIPIATVIVAVTWASLDAVGVLFDSPALRDGLLAILPGVWLFAINKLMASSVNGLRAMRIFAVVQAARPVLMLIITILFGLLAVPGGALPWMVTIEEAALCAVLAMTLFVLVPRGVWRPGLDWLRTHLSFGGKSALAGWVSEANTRVDVLMVGIFMSDRAVGIYSAASTLVEGLVQLPTILRNNINPLITQFAVARRFGPLRGLVSRSAKLAVLAMGVVCLIAVAGYPLFVRWVLGDRAYEAAWLAFALAALGLAAGAWMMPLDSFFIQVGLPERQTLFKLLVLLFNVGALLALVPIAGVSGAGAAVGMTFVFSSLLLRALMRQALARMEQ